MDFSLSYTPLLRISPYSYQLSLGIVIQGTVFKNIVHPYSFSEHFDWLATLIYETWLQTAKVRILPQSRQETPLKTNIPHMEYKQYLSVLASIDFKILQSEWSSKCFKATCWVLTPSMPQVGLSVLSSLSYSAEY